MFQLVLLAGAASALVAPGKSLAGRQSARLQAWGPDWDLKPENVLLKRAEDGAACRWIAKVADFGSVDCPQDGGSTRDVGTFGYMSPQAHDSERFGAMDKADDVFSFGVTMWEMLERDLPFKSIPFERIGAHVWTVS